MNVSKKRLAEVAAARDHDIHSFPLLVTSESLATHLLGPKVGRRALSLENGTSGHFPFTPAQLCPSAV